MSQLKVFKAHPEATLPQYSTDSAACFDLFACIWTDLGISSITVLPGQRSLISTGLKFDIPEGYSIRLHPRSGLALKSGITLVNCEGIIDSDYVDIVGVILYNTSENPFTLYHGDKFCQGELVKDIRASFEEIKEAPAKKGNRTGGFGSTGV